MIPPTNFQPLTTPEAARVLHLSQRTLEGMRSKRTGPPYYKISRMVRYDLTELRAWMTSRRMNATSHVLAGQYSIFDIIPEPEARAPR